MYTLKIKVTKEILERSMMCKLEFPGTGQNCAISITIRDIFPNAFVSTEFIIPDTTTINFDEATVTKLHEQLGNKVSINDAIRLPLIAQEFIKSFDDATPLARLQMPELEFEVSIPDSVINEINIDELKPLLVNHPTLELI